MGMAETVFRDGTEFAIRERTRVLIEGYIDTAVLDRIGDPAGMLEEMEDFLKVAGGSAGSAKDVLRERLGQDLPNFLFISAIMDYGNIATSKTLQLVLLDLHSRYPFLFRPMDPFWDKILGGESEGEERRKLETLLLPLSGLFRTDFLEVVVPNWISIIWFLRKNCSGDASNFFTFVRERLGLSGDDPAALKRFQEMITSEERLERVKKFLGINFSLGPKTGALLLSLMTENRRGFGVLRGVSREQTARLAAPVDSAVIRVMLNTGLVKIVHVNPERTEGRFTRSILTEVCQRAMELMAGRLGLIPIELDEYVWSVGTTACKHRGKFCFICPLTGICDSWIHGYVKESSGAEYLKRCFSFARPQTHKNALYLRGCGNCQYRDKCLLVDHSRGARHPVFDQKYTVRRFSSKSAKISAKNVMAPQS